MLDQGVKQVTSPKLVHFVFYSSSIVFLNSSFILPIIFCFIHQLRFFILSIFYSSVILPIIFCFIYISFFLSFFVLFICYYSHKFWIYLSVTLVVFLLFFAEHCLYVCYSSYHVHYQIVLTHLYHSFKLQFI